MNATNLNMDKKNQARADARLAARRTAIILGMLVFAWYLGFMAMRVL